MILKYIIMNMTQKDYLKGRNWSIYNCEWYKRKINNNYKIFDKDELIIRNAEYNDFVILMDKSSNFDLYKRIFEYLNVPLTIEKMNP